MAMAPKLTEGDKKLIAMAWPCFKSVPQVDYDKLREMGNYKTPASATACYLSSRKKLLSGNGDKMTARDHEVLLMGWQCFKAVPEVDYRLLQAKGNYKTPASATACYLAVRKKLIGPITAGENATPKKTAGTKRKVGKKAAVEYEAVSKRAKVSDSDGDEEEKTEVKDEDVEDTNEDSAAAEEPVAATFVQSVEQFLEENKASAGDEED